MLLREEWIIEGDDEDMKCSDAIHLMAGYVDQTLPNHSMNAMKFHLQICEDCHMEYVIWKESSMLFKAELEPVPLPEASATSMVDGVMTRLAKEDKWTFPLSAHVFKLQPTVKRWVTTISVLFLLVFGVLMYGTFQHEERSSEGDWKELTAAHVVLSIDQLKASTAITEEQRLDIRYQIIASIGDPLSFNLKPNTFEPNVGLVSGFLGIMITVVTMSWFSRV